MKRVLIFNIIYLISIIVSLGQSVESTILPPTGYTREICDEHPFAAYPCQLSLLPRGSKVLLYNGQEKGNQAAAFTIVDMEMGNRDLRQYVNAIMRLRAEYLWVQKRYGEVKFNFTNGFPAEYKKWAEGNRIEVTGNKVEWYTAGDKNYPYEAFREYLNMVFMYAGTASLSKGLRTVPYTSLQAGNVFIRGGSPGHVVIVVGVAIRPKTRKKVFLLVQSYMPTQQIHILVNPVNRNLSPWYELADTDSGRLYTPEWTFEGKELRRL